MSKVPSAMPRPVIARDLHKGERRVIQMVNCGWTDPPGTRGRDLDRAGGVPPGLLGTRPIHEAHFQIIVTVHPTLAPRATFNVEWIRSEK